MAQYFETLIGVTTLRSRAGPCVLLDCRASLADSAAGVLAYRAGHLPGAHHADLVTDLAAAHQPGVTGRHPLPDPDRLAEQFRRWGIDQDTQIVVYDADSGAFAARAWWLARWLGHPRVALLDGGLAAWCRAGGGLVPTQPTPRRGNFERRDPLVQTVSAADLAAAPGRYLLLDARAPARYRGEVEPIDPVAGHIPGARSLPFEDSLDSTPSFRSPAALRASFAVVAGSDAPAVAYCGSGVTACHLILAMQHAGVTAPALYPGSWSEWIVDPQRPVATGADP
jgi:thiosulfate/3-mercaptopyruvate sulfurtransferase